jgi:pantetheine-phosphate adenylyltransferase
MRLAVYAGTFDPITHGHLSVIDAASRVFDELIVLIARHPDKKPLFSISKRMGFIRNAVSTRENVICDYTNDLVVDYARRHGAGFLVRGIRHVQDTAYETRMANFNHSLAPDIRTFFIVADPDLVHVSSSRLKEMARQGDDGSKYCTKEVWAQLQKHLRSYPYPNPGIQERDGR